MRWIAKNRNQWSKEELEALKDVANVGPTPFVHQKYNQWAKKNDKPKRSRPSIENKLKSLGLSRVSIHQYYTRSHLADCLGIPAGTVISWGRYGLESVTPHPKSQEMFVTDKAILAYAKEYPHKFGGIPYEKLFLVLGDEKLCSFIRKNFPNRPAGKAFLGRRVVCINTGMVYSSVKTAAKENFLSVTSIYRSCRLHKTRGGLDFRYYEPEKDDSNSKRPNSGPPNIVFCPGQADSPGE